MLDSSFLLLHTCGHAGGNLCHQVSCSACLMGLHLQHGKQVAAACLARGCRLCVLCGLLQWGRA